MTRNLDLSIMRCVVATPEPSFATAASRGSSLVYFPSHYTYLRTCVTAWHGKRGQRRGSAACEGDASRTPQDVSGRRDCRTRKHRTVCQAVAEKSVEVDVTAHELTAVKMKAASMRDELRGTSIFLVGMMGCGKTTVGKLVAEALGYCFFDSDWVVEQASGGASVASIFAENGEEAFRDIESQVIAQLSSMIRLVVATGGGSVVRKANWGWMRDGITVWLDVPTEALARRVALAGTASRPILSSAQSHKDEYSAVSGRKSPFTIPYGSGLTVRVGFSEEVQALKRLGDIFEERRPLYVPADARVCVEGLAAELGGVDMNDISPERIALQVLNEIDVLIKERQRLDKEKQQLYKPH